MSLRYFQDCNVLIINHFLRNGGEGTDYVALSRAETSDLRRGVSWCCSIL
jgi:hypothetical protein